MNELRSILCDPSSGSAERYFIGGRRQRWMKSYRVGKFYAGMDTNNYVKPWHNHLKSHFLRGHTNCRGDRLIYLLSHDVDDFYQALAMRSVVRYGRHSKGEKTDILQERCLNNKTIEALQGLVIYVEGRDENRPLSLPRKAVPLVMDKHMAVEHGEYQIEEEGEFNQTEIQLGESAKRRN
ncbi:hypothetical protein BX616_006214 [Lobosporangium transversale]|nr:hypothetical protein BX616_006214 [Lobosporangium transversale]